jgi:centromere protein C
MEEVDGLFSSPEKSPAEVDGFDDRDIEESMGSDGMSMDEGTRSSIFGHIGREF